ncbi:MAG: ACT domain-containing protein [Deltaproteobacteria bacterium]
MPENKVISLKVRNHPGVMYHITGLFSRRAYNLEGILCAQLGNGETSQIYLLVDDKGILPQMMKQLNKLQDVLEVSLLEPCDRSLFQRIHELIRL